MSTIATGKEITLSFNRKEEAPLFLAQHLVFSGKAPQKYEFLGQVQISVFETAAKVDVIFTEVPSEAISTLPILDSITAGAPFRGEVALPEIMTGVDVTSEQKASLSKWVKEKNIWQFPEVKEISYRIGPEQGVEISEDDINFLCQMIQKRMELQFPSIKPQITEQEKKTN